MAFNNFRKRRAANGPSKNELRAARHKADQSRSGQSWREQFPSVNELHLDIRMETPTGMPLGQESRDIALDQPIALLVNCPTTCAQGQFDLSVAFKEVIRLRKTTHEGMGICQAGSYMDPRQPCGTKLFYRLAVVYSDSEPAA